MSIIPYPDYDVQLPPLPPAVGDVLAIASLSPNQFEWVPGGASSITKNPATSADNVIVATANSPVGLMVQCDFNTQSGDFTPRGLGVDSVDNTNHGNHFEMFKARGTRASKAALQTNDTIGGMVWHGFDGTNYDEAASVGAFVHATPSAGMVKGTAYFLTHGSDGQLIRFTANETGCGIGLGHSGSHWALPLFKLHLAGGNGTYVCEDVYSSDNFGPTFLGRKARGTQWSPSQANADDAIVAVSGRGYTNASAFSTNNVAAIVAYCAEPFTASGQGTYWTIGTTKIGENARTMGPSALIVGSNQGVGIGMLNSQLAAWLHIRAGTTTMAPIKLTGGTLKTTPTDGDLEYDGTHLYFTIGTTRTQII